MSANNFNFRNLFNIVKVVALMSVSLAAAARADIPLIGGGNPPMPPSAAVVAVVSDVAIYSDGTLGFPNGDFLFVNGNYLWADGFVRFGSPTGAYEWTDGRGDVIPTTLGDVTSTGGIHVEYPVLIGG